MVQFAHFEHLALLERQGKGSEELRNEFKVFKADDFNRECNVTVGETDERAGMPPRVQKMASVSVPLVEDMASCWRGNFLALGDPVGDAATTSGWLQPPWVRVGPAPRRNITMLWDCSRVG
jgi:hypothetical protein